MNKPRASLTGAKGEKVGLVGVSLQQRRHAARHALVAFVDEFLAEVVVYLLGCDAVVSRQGAVDELRQLKERKERILTANHLKMKNLAPVPPPAALQSAIYGFFCLINVDQRR